MSMMQSIPRVHPRSNGAGAVGPAASIAAGSALALLGVTRRSVPGLLIVGLGGALISRGVIARVRSHGPHAGARATEDEREIHLREGFLIARPPDVLYRAWRDFEHLPRILTHVHEITQTTPHHSHWVVDAPRVAGGRVEWDAELTRDEPGTRIAWRSLPGADVENRGQVRFTALPDGRGTAMHVTLHYQPPAGRVGAWIATVLGRGARGQIRDDLRHFKQRMETGEVPTIAGQPRGSCGGIGRRLAR